MIGKLRLIDQLPGASVYNCRNCSQFKSVVVEETTLTEKRGDSVCLGRREPVPNSTPVIKKVRISFP